VGNECGPDDGPRLVADDSAGHRLKRTHPIIRACNESGQTEWIKRKSPDVSGALGPKN
jgi:hypothetical protein